MLGYDVYGGAIRTCLPGLREDDWSGRHRFVPFTRFRKRSFKVTADMISAALQSASCAQSPPPEWREYLQTFLEPRGRTDDELETELLRLEQERDQERVNRSQADQTIEAERESAAATASENDHLRRRVTYLEAELQKHQGAPAGPTPPDRELFQPDFCAEIPEAATHRLSLVGFPESQWDSADDLDRHSSTAWAKRAWRALTAMEAYAQAKGDGTFTGSFRDFCQEGRQSAIPVHWIALSESATTDNNDRFRQLRTLPIDPEVCGEDEIYMPAHVKIVAGGNPAPRFHFYDDTSGTTGKVHIGYFGPHVDNKAR